MALQFSLLGSPEMYARAPQPKLVDVPGAIAAGYRMQGEISDVQEKLRQRQAAEQDRRLVQEGLKAGTLDLFTPKGIESALTQLRGQVSPEFYMKLGEQAQAAKQADLRFQKSLADMDTTALTQYNAGIESSMPLLDNLYQQYKADAEAGGAESAAIKFDENRKKLLAQMQGKMVGPNTPMFNPQVIAALQSVSPEILPGMISASKYQTQQITNALNAARARELATRQQRMPTGTTNMRAPDGTIVANMPGIGLVDVATGDAYTGDPAALTPVVPPRATAAPNTAVTTFVGSDDNQYRFDRRSGRTEVLDRTTGEYRELPGGLPAGVTMYTPGSTAQAQAAARGQRVILTPDDAARISRITRTVKLNVPPFGQGEAGTNARNQFYKSLLADIDALGQGDTEAAIRMAMATASRKTRETIISRDTTLRSEEDEAKVLLGKIEDELKKIGGPASPYLREKWNQVETRIVGEPTFTKLNLYMTQFIDTMGRLSSNATGAAGTPVAYLNFAKTVLDKDFNLEQIKEFRPAFDTLLDARRTGVKNAFEYLNELGAPTEKRKPSGEAATPAGREADRVSTIRAEYDSALESSRTATDPAARARALANARAARSELARLGVQLPEVGEPTQPPVQPGVNPEAAIARTLRRANIPYEPDLYDYRIMEDGSVARRRKAQ